MACKILSITNYLTHSFPLLFLRKFPSSSSFKLIHYSSTSNSNFKGLNSTTISTNNFTWDDVIQIGNSEYDPSNLSGFFDKVSACNRNLEKLREFVPFVVEEQVVGYVHNGFAAHLKRFQDVFLFPQHNGVFDWHITLHPTLKSPEDRTSAVANVIKCLGKELVPGIRNELFPVTTCFGTQALFSLERAAAPYFGIKRSDLQDY